MAKDFVEAEPKISADLPQRVRELLQQRGMSWPPDEETRKQMMEVAKRSSGMVSVSSEVLEEVMREFMEGGRFTRPCLFDALDARGDDRNAR